MHIIIYGNEFQRERLDEVAQLLALLRERGLEGGIEQGYHHYLSACTATATEAARWPAVAATPTGDEQLAVSIGGDGTLLTTVMHVVTAGVPVVGINMGHLGYLTACSVAEAPAMVDQLLTGQYDTEDRAMLRVTCDQATIRHPFALNEIAILRSGKTSTIAMETSLNDIPLTTYRGDGLVVCTPTGSTAYNLSAGGPVMNPTTACLALTPISPHSLTMRPMVVPDTTIVTVRTITREGNYLVSVDGEDTVCPCNSVITIDRAPLSARIIYQRGHDFASTLRHKLLWGADRL